MPIDWDKVPTEDLQAIRDKNWEKVSTPTLQWLQNGGQGPIQGTTPVTPTPAPQQGTTRTVPQKMWDMAKPMVRPMLEIGGGVVGGVVGMGGGPAPAIAGAGLGYTAGRTLADKIEGVTPTDPLELARRTGEGFVEGSTMEMGGNALSKGLNKAGTALAKSDWPKRLYGGSVRTPSGDKWDRLYKGDELTKRQKLIQAGLKDEILPNNYGMAKARAKVNDITDQISDMINNLTKQTPSNQFVSDALTPIKGKAIASGPEATSVVDKIEKENLAKGGYNREFSPRQLQMLKTQLADEVEWSKEGDIVNVKSKFTQNAKKALAESAMKALEEMSPEIKYLNEKSAARIDLIRAIEHTINREAATDTVGFGTKLLALRNFGVAIADMVLRLPTNKARLAFAINKGAQWQAKTMTKAAAYGAVPQILHFDSQGNLIMGGGQ